VRYPGQIKPGSVSNEIVQHHDWLPTFLELAGNKTVVEDLKKGIHQPRLHHLWGDCDHDEVQRDVRQFPEDSEAQYVHGRSSH
jgi:arylsulfatase A-like enzyme